MKIHPVVFLSTIAVVIYVALKMVEAEELIPFVIVPFILLALFFTRKEFNDNQDSKPQNSPKRLLFIILSLVGAIVIGAIILILLASNVGPIG